jgi:hypothetical protein
LEARQGFEEPVEPIITREENKQEIVDTTSGDREDTADAARELATEI